ncbi:MAG: hypothetical protein ACLFS4_06085 [Opitutales bacterium]
MNFSFFQGIILIVAVACPVLFSFAGATGDKEHTFVFRVYGVQPAEYSGLYYRGDKGGKKPLHFRKKHRSQSFKGSLPEGEKFFKFYTRAESVETGGEVFVPVATVKVQPAWQEVLFVFHSSRGRAAGGINNPDVAAVEDGDAAFPAGTMRIMNITGRGISGIVNRKRLALRRDGLSAPVNADDSGLVRVRFTVEGAARHYLIYQNEHFLSSGHRGLLILRAPARKGSTRISGYLLEGLP